MKKVSASTAAFKLVTRSVSALAPYSRNSRTHNEAQLAQLAASIKEFGFTNPVLIDEQGTIIAGEGRVAAAKKLGMEVVPCIVLVGLTEVQKAAYVIADNKLSLASGWDSDMLAAELGRITDMGFDMSLTGFSEVEVLALLDEVEAAVTELTTAANAQATVNEPPTADQDASVGTVYETPTAPQDPNKPVPTTVPPAASAQAAWVGMPEFDQPSNAPFRTIHVHFACQEAVDAFKKLIAKPITDRTKFLWFPEQAKVARKEVVYE